MESSLRKIGPNPLRRDFFNTIAPNRPLDLQPTRTHSASFDDLIGARQEGLRHGETERLRGVEVDDQLECRRLLHRKVGRLGALQDLSGVNALLVIDRRIARAIAEQAAGDGEVARQGNRWNGMARCQRRDLWPEANAAKDESIGLHLDEGRESGVDLAFRAGLQNTEVYARRARSFLHMFDDSLGARFIRLHEQGDHPSLRNQLQQQFEQFGGWRGRAAQTQSEKSAASDSGNATGRSSSMARTNVFAQPRASTAVLIAKTE
jgi:hypothetical protein